MSVAPAASARLRPSATARHSETALFTDKTNPAPTRLCIGGRRAERTFAGLQIAPSNLNRCKISHIKSGEADGYPKTEDMLVDEETLQRNLDRAIQEEDYARAAKIRDDLRILHEDTEASVLAANARFYNAFKNGDLAAMHSIWAKGDHVYVVHPAAGRISGYDVVLQSWEMVCNADYEFPLNIDLKNIEVHVRGDLVMLHAWSWLRPKEEPGESKSPPTSSRRWMAHGICAFTMLHTLRNEMLTPSGDLAWILQRQLDKHAWF